MTVSATELAEMRKTMTGKAIAANLGVSIGTVTNHPEEARDLGEAREAGEEEVGTTETENRPARSRRRRPFLFNSR